MAIHIAVMINEDCERVLLGLAPTEDEARELFHKWMDREGYTNISRISNDGFVVYGHAYSADNRYGTERNLLFRVETVTYNYIQDGKLLPGV